jgi:uncharacterized protein YndB with AHSA1/START domain
MTLDPIATADLVAREVSTGQRDGVATRVVVARRTYATDQADLWDAVTNTERLPRWFLPVTGDLRIGGRYQIEGNAAGTVEQCDEPDRFAVTWEYAEQVSWLTVTLTPVDGGTTLELAHEAPVDPEFWAQYGPGATGIGWDLGLLGLGLHVDSGEPVDPMYRDNWAVTLDGIAFVRHAATRWADAAMADGDDAPAAGEAAENTVTFYTVPPDA